MPFIYAVDGKTKTIMPTSKKGMIRFQYEIVFAPVKISGTTETYSLYAFLNKKGTGSLFASF